ncbi:D-alanyl-D-alanine carboxypeptidase/D-alanyl-D-alanine-endopeptidase [Burkholderia territorii]|uniref:D-alanyl-D-alanine carboxypeptidase/D-alanyl-D-alanine-endopeptidase n=1 Tax=Burkholderia territorii TaxID=1503055 RepID=A0A6L3NGD5_9BURK|nr:D-alanyl-D-alanine carboxypeptidase/D-alanyl-D-alanine-endopeptidase [Burkholderia territorii]MBM2772790.1 D-alanyl-D-alanine carboxypeptidase/D-alanyl-D-alanine-endopeptidase [Burkholderia territorii]VWB04735.1 D-alanyl-D-alanine carboxypeptidase/D-alanyl-D-alanine-endopeptidase [Burkholderia territorii]
MISGRRVLAAVALISTAAAALIAGCGGNTTRSMQGEIEQVIGASRYRQSTWSINVIDPATGATVYAIQPDALTYVGSTRKLFSVGMALNQLGADHQFVTPVYALGSVEASGTLDGNLILVASGDLTMGGRANPDGTIAFSGFDHNEANSLGNAGIVQADPLAGYDKLASQIAAAGIKRIGGDVVIDDRLFVPFDFREEFNVSPIFVNDDVVDVLVNPGAAGATANVDWRPKSAAFGVTSSVSMVGANADTDIEFAPRDPTCFGTPRCFGNVSGTLAAQYVPPLTGAYPLVKTFRITDPASYARTVLVEALARHGVAVGAPAVEVNPRQSLPPQGAYASASPVARLVSPPYREYAKFILKVSYNIGADVSLVLYGLASSGATTMHDALATERAALESQFHLAPDSFAFVDGSGGLETKATGTALTTLLAGMQKTAYFDAYLDALPVLGVDGSLGFVTEFMQDASLAGAKGHVRAKTGTYVGGKPVALKGQALAGYVDAKSGRRYVFMLSVNNVPFGSIDDVLPVFQDQGRIAAILWKYL